MPDYLSAAQAVAHILLRNLDLSKITLPSKMFDAWACKRPILLGVEGEARHVLEQARGGLFVTPEDALSLANALLVFKFNPHLRDEMGEYGRAWVVKHYSRQAQATQLAALFGTGGVRPIRNGPLQRTTLLD